jgi:hypothetical protein
VRLIRPNGARPLDSNTKNVSSDGFYCVVREPFTAGEQIRCILALPAFDPARQDDLIALDCLARVVRVELLGSAEYGIACAIEQYQVMLPLQEHELARGISAVS